MSDREEIEMRIRDRGVRVEERLALLGLLGGVFPRVRSAGVDAGERAEASARGTERRVTPNSPLAP